MIFRLRAFSGIAIAAVLLSACNQNTANAPAPAAETETTPPGAATPTPAAASPPSTQMAVNTVESVMVTRSQDAPTTVMISASGTVLSLGWTDAKLVPIEDTNGDTSIKSFTFVATSPATPEAASSVQPIDAQLQVDALPTDVKAIRIVSATNEVAATAGNP